MIGKILLHIRKNPRKVRRWQTSVAHSENNWWSVDAAPERLDNFYPNLNFIFSTYIDTKLYKYKHFS